MRIDETTARRLTGREVTVDEVEQVKREMHTLHDRAESLEAANAALLRMANGAEYRAQCAEDRLRLYMETERRTYEEAESRIMRACDLALRALSAPEYDDRADDIEEALGELAVARVMTVALLPEKAVKVSARVGQLEQVLRDERPVAVELVVGEEVAA